MLQTGAAWDARLSLVLAEALPPLGVTRGQPFPPSSWESLWKQSSQVLVVHTGVPAPVTPVLHLAGEI